MASLSRELVFIILQFLDEEKYQDTAHKLEMESGLFFNMKYFEERVLEGDWDEIERYLAGFTALNDNRFSMKTYFEIRKQKYLEALDKDDRINAVELLRKDLKVFANFNEDLFKEIAMLLTLGNLRENEQLKKYGDTRSARLLLLAELKKLIDGNPLFQGKLQFPTLKNSRLRSLVNQSSLNWQHGLCKNPQVNPDIATLYKDHVCPPSNGTHVTSSINPFINLPPKNAGFVQMGPQVPLLPWIGAPPIPYSTAPPIPYSAAPPMPHPAAPGSPIVVPAPTNQVPLKRPLTPPSSNPTADYQREEQEMKKQCLLGASNEVHLPRAEIDPRYYADLPRIVGATLNVGSSVSSIEFHPAIPNLLLVGTDVGDVSIWDLVTKQKRTHRVFKIWNPKSCSMLLQDSLAEEPTLSINRVVWNSDGSRFGVAYSKHLVHLNTYQVIGELEQPLEIEAHVGGVNDLVFCQLVKGKWYIVTCGDDKIIKVWDADDGAVQHTFEGHDAPVYSICPHVRENIPFLFSISIYGKIRAWLYNNEDSKVDYTAPGHSCTTMAYSSDGERLFSCGTSKDGETYLVEWSETEGSIKRKYNGFQKRSTGVVQFDTAKNRYLAAGDECKVKFWDMDYDSILTTTDVDGVLPASPRVRFNKCGNLLAVSTNDNCIKILGNPDGLGLLRSADGRSYYASRYKPNSTTKKPINSLSGNASAMVGTSAATTDRGAAVASIVGPKPINSLSGNSSAMVGTSAATTDQGAAVASVVGPKPINSLSGNASAMVGTSAATTDRGAAVASVVGPKPINSLSGNASAMVGTSAATTDRGAAVASVVGPQNSGSRSSVDLKTRNIDDPVDKSKMSKLIEIKEPSQCTSLRITDSLPSAKVIRIVYTNSGVGILALACDALHKIWKWQKTDRNATGRATACVAPQLWQPSSGLFMTNETNERNLDEVVHCFALSNNDSYLISASGGKVSLFNTMTFKKMATLMSPPPAATCFAFHPQDNNVVAIGMDDSSIQIYNVRVDEVISKLRCHQNRVTGLAFSSTHNVLISSGADAQLCLWKISVWEKLCSNFLQIPSSRVSGPPSETRVQFHNNQTHFLAVHETQLAIYDALKLECLTQWMPQDSLITHATYSCDGNKVYASSVDGSISIFSADLQLRCRISSTAYLNTQPSSSVYPMVVAAHPFEPSQFAVGLTDGGVQVFQPLESDGKWETIPQF